ERRAAEPLGLLLDAGRRLDRPPAEPPFDEVDARPRQAREGRAEEGEEVAAAALEPREPEQRQERVAERRLPEPEPVLDGGGHAEGRERRLERRAPALERRADDGAPVGRSPGADQVEE